MHDVAQKISKWGGEESLEERKLKRKKNLKEKKLRRKKKRRKSNKKKKSWLAVLPAVSAFVVYLLYVGHVIM